MQGDRTNRNSRAVQDGARRLRRDQTATENLLWQRLRGRRCGGLKFGRQAVMGTFIADFACEAARVIIELDGNVHDDRQEQDATRTEWLEQRGYKVIRFPNDDVETDIDRVLMEIETECVKRRP